MKTLLKSSILSALGIGTSRILGLIREILTAAYFGAGWHTDAFFLAWKIPNIFRRVLGEGAFNPIIIPTLGKLKEKDRETYLSSLFFYICLTSLVISILLNLSAPYIVELLSSEHNREFIQSATNYLRYLSCYLVFATLNAFFMSYIQFRGRFFVSYLSQAIFNLTVIGFLILFHNSLGLFSLVSGALVGGFLQIAFIYYFARDLKLKPIFELTKEVKYFFRKLIPQIGSAGVGHLSTLIEAFFATAVGGGILSALYYAMRIFQLGVSLITVALSNVGITEVSKTENKEKALRESLELALKLSVPASIGLFLLSKPITEVIYQHGIFKAEDTQKVALYLSLYSLGLVPYTLFQVSKIKLYQIGKLERAFLYSLLWFFIEALTSAIGIFLFHFGGWIISFSYTFGVLVTFLIFLFKERIYKLTRLKVEIPFVLLWIFEIIYLTLLVKLIGNPYLVVLVGIPTFGGVYLFYLWRSLK
jgi:putative peptidoglycan lipid II flippase